MSTMSEFGRLDIPEHVATIVPRMVERAWDAHKTGERKVCWSPAIFPYQLYRNFDIDIIYPECDGSGAAQFGTAVKYATVAENVGYSRDVCPFARINIGKAMDGVLPPPDFLVTIRTLCSTYVNWWEDLARYYDVPLFVLDVPWWEIEPGSKLDDHYVQYWNMRCQDLIEFLEEQTGRKFDKEKFEEGLRVEMQQAKLFQELLDMMQRKPAPVSEWELLPMIPAMLYRGNPWCIEAIQSVKDLVQERIDQNLTAVPNEKYRLLYLANPPWPLVNEFKEWTEECGAVWVASDILTMFCGLTNVKDLSLESLLYNYAMPSGSLDYIHRFEIFKKKIEDFQIDGVVFMANRDCKTIAMPINDTARMFEDLGIPCMAFEGTVADPRDLDSEHIKAQFATFFDLLEQRKQMKEV